MPATKIKLLNATTKLIGENLDATTASVTDLDIDSTDNFPSLGTDEFYPAVIKYVRNEDNTAWNNPSTIDDSIIDLESQFEFVKVVRAAGQVIDIERGTSGRHAWYENPQIVNSEIADGSGTKFYKLVISVVFASRRYEDY